MKVTITLVLRTPVRLGVMSVLTGAGYRYDLSIASPPGAPLVLTKQHDGGMVTKEGVLWGFRRVLSPDDVVNVEIT